MATEAVSTAQLLGRAGEARDRGQGDEAAALYTSAADLAERAGDLTGEIAAVLGLAGCQSFNEAPVALPVRLHSVYERVSDVRDRARVAAALARCWAYAGEPRRAEPFADVALDIAEAQAEAPLLGDALDAALTTYWGPDDLDRRRSLAVRLGDVTAHLRDVDARLQAHLWGLTVAWEVLDVTRMHHEMRALERLGEESPRARFFAASRRLALDLFRGRTDTFPELQRQVKEAADAVYFPDAFAVQHAMSAYAAIQRGDAATCAQEAPLVENLGIDEGVPVLLAESAVVWLGAQRLDSVARVVALFTPDTLAGLPRDCDWLLTLQCVLEGALAVGDRVVAADVVDLLAPYEGRSVVNAGAVAFHGITDDTLSRAYALLGDTARAARLRDTALETYRRVGASWWRERLLANAAAVPAPARGPDSREAHLQHDADGTWTVGSGTALGHLPDLRGLHHLRVLVSRPGVAVEATALVAARAGGATAVQGDLGDVLDERAMREYRERLEALAEELAEAELWADEGRRERAADEQEALLAALASATGLGGRPRTPGSTHEKARVAVRKAVVSALARMAEIDPWLGRHLRDRVRTGHECVYEPDPDHPVTWVVS